MAQVIGLCGLIYQACAFACFFKTGNYRGLAS